MIPFGWLSPSGAMHETPYLTHRKKKEGGFTVSRSIRSDEPATAHDKELVSNW